MPLETFEGSVDLEFRDFYLRDDFRDGRLELRPPSYPGVFAEGKPTTTQDYLKAVAYPEWRGGTVTGQTGPELPVVDNQTVLFNGGPTAMHTPSVRSEGTWSATVSASDAAAINDPFFFQWFVSPADAADRRHDGYSIKFTGLGDGVGRAELVRAMDGQVATLGVGGQLPRFTRPTTVAVERHIDGTQRLVIDGTVVGTVRDQHWSAPEKVGFHYAGRGNRTYYLHDIDIR